MVINYTLKNIRARCHITGEYKGLHTKFGIQADKNDTSHNIKGYLINLRG